ncbi:hypothetical protein EC991_006357 [Linnemannia zychae]|nr:hypothetical protein EC991_006357 [Linnemannia zychae]
MTCLRVERLKLEDIERGGPWMSLKLKELEVQFDMQGGIDLQDEQRQHRLVFDRVSTLAGLERLSFNAKYGSKLPGLQLCVSHGLGALLPLVNMFFLDVSNSIQKLELADVCWMTEKWPKLRIVHGNLHHNRDIHTALQEYLHKHNAEGISCTLEG